MNGGKTGGGYITKSGDQAHIAWKGGGASTSIGNIDIGKTYAFKYEFSEIGTGVDTGMSAALTITDENGTIIESESGLDIRNFAIAGSGYPISEVQVYNRASEGSVASVTFGNAVSY